MPSLLARQTLSAASLIAASAGMAFALQRATLANPVQCNTLLPQTAATTSCSSLTPQTGFSDLLQGHPQSPEEEGIAGEPTTATPAEIDPEATRSSLPAAIADHMPGNPATISGAIRGGGNQQNPEPSAQP